jgi:predicted unusual protein kinase regulating ubiquinone biosynthesis (AarF/ABC1/UbiB family)
VRHAFFAALMTEHVKGGRLRRMARLAGVTAKTARDVVTARAMQKIAGADDTQVAEALKPTAARMVEVLGEMKGAATKLGQFISLADQETFPEEARKVLHKLLNQTPETMSPDEANQRVREAFGKEPEDLFEAWDPKPFASASMGQVHAARLHDGRDVVVKLQFPGVDGAIESDVHNAVSMARGMALGGGVFNIKRYVDEIAETLRRELDYREELAQLKAYQQALEPWPDLVVPEPVEELCTETILVLERLRGPTMLEFSEDKSASEARRFEVASQLVAAIWGPFLRQRLIHADPHPGNYIVMDDGRLGVLDFGATKLHSVPFTVAYWQIVLAAMQQREISIYDVMKGVGFELGTDEARTRAWLQELARIVEMPIRNDFYDWGACRLAVDCRKHYMVDPAVALRVRGPVESLMFYRAAVGASGDFRLMGAKGNFRQVLRDVVTVAWAEMDPALNSAVREAGVDLDADAGAKS